MKNKILAVSTLVFVFAFAINVYAVGQNNGTEINNQVQQRTQAANQGEDNQIQVQNQIQTQDKGKAVNQVQSQNQKQATSTAKQQDQTNAEQHRSTVADFVQNLLQVADREGGIGEQVRVIARQQNQSASTTIQAMEKVQTRNKVKTFLFGSDYKNLGALRSEMVKTENRLEQLNKLVGDAQNDADKTELQNQVQTLEQEQIKIENFVKTQEGKFSLFGWLTKLFNR